MRILVIEDDFVSRTVLTRFLEPFGEVTAAVDGHAGLSSYRQAVQAGNPFDLVTLDMMMPGIDGLQVLKEMRTYEGEQPGKEIAAKVLMTTALDDVKNVTAAYDAMCDDYLTKPIRKATLFEKLQKLGFALPS